MRPRIVTWQMLSFPTLISGDAALLAEWAALHTRIVALTGRSSERNLLAHAVVTRDVQVKQGPIMTSGFLGLTETVTSYRVEQDATLLLSGKHKPASADFNSLFAYCEDLMMVLNDLDVFLGKLL
jgi:hypothetical protein